MGIRAWTLRIFLLCAVTLAATPFVSAQDIYKCVEGNATAYQSMPCPNGQVEMRMNTVAQARSDVQRPAPLNSTRPPPRSNVWPWRRTLTLGMSDDEVLNLPGWGIPE